MPHVERVYAQLQCHPGPEGAPICVPAERRSSKGRSCRSLSRRAGRAGTSSRDRSAPQKPALGSQAPYKLVPCPTQTRPVAMGGNRADYYFEHNTIRE